VKKGVLSLTLLCAVASPLAAQSRIERPKAAPNVKVARMTSEEQGRKLLIDYARCVIASRPKAVAEVFSSQFDASGAALRKAIIDICLSEGKFSVNPDLFRRYLYVEMYRQYDQGRRDLLARFPALPYDPTAPVSPDLSASARINELLLQLSACAYSRQPDAVKAIVTSGTGSSTQKAGYDRVIPDLGPCVQKDEKLVLSRAVLESAFGEYLYRSQMSGATASIGKTQ